MPADHQNHTPSAWFKSSYSGGNATECVECACAGSGILIRDSKCRRGSPVISVAAEPWKAFLQYLGQGSLA